MCEPTTLTIIGLTTMAVSGGIQAYGQYQQGKAQKRYYNYLAGQNEREAQMAETTAKMQSQIYQTEASQQAKELKSEVARTLGAQKAAMSALGIYGVTAEDILQDTVSKAALDEALIRWNADVASWQAKTQGAQKAWSLRSQAQGFRLAGKQYYQAGKIGAFSTLLGTAGSVIYMGSGLLKKPTPETTKKEEWSPTKLG